MTQQQGQQFVDLLLAFLRGETVTAPDMAYVRSAVEQVLADLPADIRKQAQCQPDAYRAIMSAAVERRWFQTSFRRKALEAIGGLSFVSYAVAKKIFFSYRRAEAVHLTRHLAHALRRFPKFQVFFDQSSLIAGPFPAQLAAAVTSCDVLLIMSYANTFERTHDPEDWVRQEITLGLESGRLLVPVLIDGAPFPLAENLPASLRDLCSFNAYQFSTHNFDASLQGLISFITLPR